MKWLRVAIIVVLCFILASCRSVPLVPLGAVGLGGVALGAVMSSVSKSAAAPKPSSSSPTRAQTQAQSFTADESLRARGVAAYQNFEYAEALRLLSRYLQSGSAPAAKRGEAYAYLAASHFLSGEAEQGRAVFAQLLHEHPAYRLDASVFRPDVVAAFEAQKRIANR